MKMNDFELLPDGRASIGTSFKGNLHVQRHVLVSIFGEPQPSNDRDRSAYEWRLRVIDQYTQRDHVVTIYDWCVPGAHNDAFDDWHIGAKTQEGADALREVIFRNAHN